MKKITLGLVLISYSFCFAQYYSLHWKDYNPYELYYESHIQFINDSVGWIMPNRDWGEGYPFPENNALFKTIDGGKSWFCVYELESGWVDYAEQMPFIFTDADTGYYFSNLYNTWDWKVWKTTDGGSNWNNVYTFNPQSFFRNSFFLNGRVGWLSDPHDLYKTTDGGFSWNVGLHFSQFGFRSYPIFFNESNGVFLVSDTYSAVFYKTTDGQTWDSVTVLNGYVESVSFINPDIGYIAIDGNLSKTTDGGENWTNISLPIGGSPIEFVKALNDSIVVAVGSTTYPLYLTSFYISTNAGISWNLNSITGSYDTKIEMMSVIDQDNIFLSCNHYVFKVTEMGTHWEKLAIGPTYNLESVIAVPGGEVFAVGWKQDSLTLNYECSIISKHPLWRTKSIHQNQKLKCIAAKNNSELFIGGYDYLNGGRSVIYKCDNKGDNLELKYNSDGQIVNSMQFITELNGIAVGDEGMLLKTQDGGNTWIQETVTTSEDLNFVKFSSQLGFIGGSNGLLLRTSDGGINWSQISIGVNKEIKSILIHTQSNIWLVGKDGLIMKSEDAGLNWITISASNEYDLNSIASKSNLHIGIYGGKKVDNSPFIMESHDSGNSWVIENTSPNLQSINFVYPTGYSAWAVGDYGTILHAAVWFTPVELTTFTATLNRTKVSLNWQTATELNNQGFEIQRKFENSDWATIGFRTGKGTTTEPNSYFYEDDISEISATKLLYRLKQIDFDGTISYSDEVEVITQPFDYALLQNYPNPFNPVTIIKYEVPQVSNVKIEVFDLLGRVIKVLVDEQKTAGRYEIKFDASSLASGIYYYRIKANEFVQTKKMMLIK